MSKQQLESRSDKLLPTVDVLSHLLIQWLKKHYHVFNVNETKPSTILTFDVDIAYAIKAKPLVRQVGAMTKELFSMKFSNLNNRIQVLMGKRKDPFDVYDYLEELAGTVPFPMMFFFHVHSQGKYDKAVNVNSRSFSNLVKRISRFAHVGIHPSYAGGQDAYRIMKEKNVLEQIIGRKITHSRHHFLRILIPNTYIQLVYAGIEEDFSMGFAQYHWWRAGTTKSFRFFDAKDDVCMPLKVHPISVMDGTLAEYLNMPIKQANQTIHAIMAQVKEQNGCFIPLWHNETISNTGKWKHWREGVFEPMIQSMKTMSK
jgi:hypothetical protein